MKMNLKSWLFVFALLGSVAQAADSAPMDLAADFDSLGGNQILLDRAKALEPEKNVSIVQDRIVSRRNRLEIAPEFSGTFGGDAYVRTRNLGLNLQFHFSPRWSVGVKYNHSFNKLTAEGESLVDQAYADFQKNPSKPTMSYPEVSYPKSETLALINWYPIYGKMNLLDKAVAHFDWYLVGGYGSVQLSSGTTPTYTGGAGIGFWLNPHFSTRMEMRYQNYKAQYINGEKNLDLAVGSLQMGYLL